ncbi:MAG: hypothetical protein HC821_00690 [Lewinella sp.]|nr:hypothetical protein [Lewinella sp.]
MLAILGLLCCQQAPSAPVRAQAEIRYLADQRELRGDLILSPGDSLSGHDFFSLQNGSVAFLGSNMTARIVPGGMRWRTEMQVDFPNELRFTFPRNPDQKSVLEDRLTLALSFSPPFPDSLPSIWNTSEVQRFEIGSAALGAHESIVVFFEPLSGGSGSVSRITISGPTASSQVVLPTVAQSELKAGDYEVYLVKQQIARDTLPGLLATTEISYHTRSRPVKIIRPTPN